MSDSLPPPVRVFRMLAISLILCTLALAGALFGVRLDALAPARGTITSKHLLEIRARRAGVLELGWSEGPGRWHRVQAGDEVPGGQQLAVLRDDSARPESPLELHRDAFPVNVPDTFAHWLVLSVAASPGQAIQAGDRIATVVPIDPATKKPLGLCARLEFEERHLAGVSVGQSVRLQSAIFSQREYGTARGTIETIEPWGEPGPDGTRRFTAIATLDETPFECRLGSTVAAETVVGRRRLVQIILSH